MENTKPSIEGLKSILRKVKPIYILLGCILIMCVIYFFFSGPSARSENKRLKKEVELIQKERDTLKKNIEVLRISYDKMEDSAKIKKQEIDNISQRILAIEQNVLNSSNELYSIKSGLNDINIQISNVTKKPIKRVGDSLLNSLRIKLNQ